MERNISDRLYKINAYLCHSLKAGRVDIKGIQSSFLYSFACNITKNLWPYYAFDKIEKSRTDMIGYLSKNKKRKKKKAILINCLPGIEIGNKEEIKAGQSIFRIINHIQASKILEIGTFFGIDTLYMIESNNLANCISLCDNPEMEILARDVFEKQKKPEIKMFAENHVEDLKKSLAILNKVDFVLFNASSDYEQRLDDFKSCLSVIHSGTVFVMKYIHNSPEMEKIWNIAKNHNEVTASIDLYYIGILLFRQDVEKRNYIISQKKIKNENLH